MWVLLHVAKTYLWGLHHQYSTLFYSILGQQTAWERDKVYVDHVFEYVEQSCTVHECPKNAIITISHCLGKDLIHKPSFLSLGRCAFLWQATNYRLNQTVLLQSCSVNFCHRASWSMTEEWYRRCVWLSMVIWSYLVDVWWLSLGYLWDSCQPQPYKNVAMVRYQLPWYS